MKKRKKTSPLAKIRSLEKQLRHARYEHRFCTQQINDLKRENSNKAQVIEGLTRQLDLRQHLQASDGSGLTRKEAADLREQNERLKADYETLFQQLGTKAKAPTSKIVLPKGMTAVSEGKPLHERLADLESQVIALALNFRTLQRDQTSEADVLRTQWKSDIEDALRSLDPND